MVEYTTISRCTHYHHANCLTENRFIRQNLLKCRSQQLSIFVLFKNIANSWMKVNKRKQRSRSSSVTHDFSTMTFTTSGLGAGRTHLPLWNSNPCLPRIPPLCTILRYQFFEISNFFKGAFGDKINLF